MGWIIYPMAYGRAPSRTLCCRQVVPAADDHLMQLEKFKARVKEEAADIGRLEGLVIWGFVIATVVTLGVK